MVQSRSSKLFMAENPHYNPTTGLAHLILAGTSGWALRQIAADKYIWSMSAFTFLLGHSLLGVLHYGHPNVLKILNKIYKFTSSIAEIGTLSLINTDLFLVTDHNQWISFAPLFSCLCQIPIQLVSKKYSNSLNDVIIIANVVPLVNFAMYHDNAWAGGLAALSTLNYFLLRRISERYEVPKNDVVTIGLSFLVIFGVNSLREAKLNNTWIS